ncbi:MAG: NAD(P)-binding domain-containing protein [Gaiellaceae bacterium]
MAKNTSVEAVVIGAGPYGLSVAAHLRALGVETQVLGRPMSYWRHHMPAGMLLRSSPRASSIADPAGELTIGNYAAARGSALARPIPLTDFIAYGDWFRSHLPVEVDTRRVQSLAATDDHFQLALEDGSALEARSVVVATGLERFGLRPREFDDLPADRVSHSSDHEDFSGFHGRRVTVLGGGQSAAESAALLHEAGAEVELVTRSRGLHWLTTRPLDNPSRLQRLLYPPTEAGPPGLNRIVATPTLFRSLPDRLRLAITRKVLRPAVADWVKPRLEGVELRIDRSITGATDGRPEGEGLELSFDDGSRARVDHLLLATGYRVDIARLPLLAPLLGSLRLVRGSPRLNASYESSVPGLYFVGASATECHGPLMRFVAGTGFAARAVSASVRERRP